MQIIKPLPFKEAVDKFGSKSLIGSTLNTEQWAALPHALRDRAYFSSQIESARFLQRSRDSIADFLQEAREEITLPDGTKTTALKIGSRADFIKRTQDFAIAEGMGPLDPKDAGTIKDIRTERRLGLIFDTQVRMAQDYGNWNQGMDPDVLNAFPAQRFIRVIPVKEPRDTHHLHENEVQLKTDLAFWKALNQDFGNPYGPWGWGCGHDVEDVDRAEAERIGLVTPDQNIQPAEESFNADLQASVRGLDPEMVGQLKESFGDQIQVRDNAAWWTGDRRGKALAIPPKPKATKLPPTVTVPGTPDFPASVDQLEKVKDLGGSTGATLMRDPKTGSQFVLKYGQSASHVREEFAAGELYRSMGVAVPEAKLFEGTKPALISKHVPGIPLNKYLKEASSGEREIVIGKVREHFAADALIGNWDVAGLELDNILVDASGKPWRIDNGGALRFRAQGAAKTADQWNAYPTELWTLRDPTANAQTAKLFGGLDIYGIARQIGAIDDAKVLAAAPAEVKDMISARLANMKKVSQKALDYEATQFKAGYADNVTKHAVGLRKAEAFNGMADQLKQSHPGDVRPVDAQGNAFDRLRTPKESVKEDPSQAMFNHILEGVKTINHHHTSGDVNYNTQKVAKALGQKPALEKLLAAGSADQKAMAAHYLGFINQIEAAQGNTAKKVAQLTKFHLAASEAGSSRSVVAQVADYMAANGGDWKVIEDWSNAQAGSSLSPESRALKGWLMQRLDGASPDSFHLPPDPGPYQAMKKKYGDKFDRTFEIYHAFVQEVLGSMNFTGNDQQARLVRVLRTEQTTSAVPFRKGTGGVYKRGVNESGSLFAPVFSGTRTVTAVPHTRITGIYFMERTPGGGPSSSLFYGDHENEVTFMSWGLKAKNLGSTAGDVNLSPGHDHTKWEL